MTLRAVWDRLSLAERLRLVRSEAEARGVDIDSDLAYLDRMVRRAERRIARAPEPEDDGC